MPPEEPDFDGFLAFLKANETMGKREVVSVGYHQYGVPINRGDSFIKEKLASGVLVETTHSSGRRGRPRIVVTSATQ